NRQHIENHPLRLVAGLAEAFHHAQTLGVLQLLLLRSLDLHPLANLEAEGFHVDLLEKLLDAFRAHHGDVLAMVLLFELALALIGDHFAERQISHLAWIDHDESFEVQHTLELAQRDIEQMADARGQTFEEPHVRAGARELNVAEAFAADARQRHFDAALIADHAAVLHPLVFAAEAFPVRDRAENARAEQTVTLRLERAVVDGFRFGDFAETPAPDLLRARQRDADRVKIGGQISPFVRRGSHYSLAPFFLSTHLNQIGR